MKICPRCKVEKELEKFGKNKAKKDSLQTFCKQCAKEYASGFYKKEENHKTHIQDVQERRVAKRSQNKQMVYEYLLTHHCIDCGETDPIVLEFDHLRDKRMNVSKLVLAGYPKETILEEISKCVVRCANCHRRKTAKDQGWYKNK